MYCVLDRMCSSFWIISVDSISSVCEVFLDESRVTFWWLGCEVSGMLVRSLGRKSMSYRNLYSSPPRTLSCKSYPYLLYNYFCSPLCYKRQGVDFILSLLKTLDTSKVKISKVNFWTSSFMIYKIPYWAFLSQITSISCWNLANSVIKAFARPNDRFRAGVFFGLFFGIVGYRWWDRRWLYVEEVSNIGQSLQTVRWLHPREWLNSWTVRVLLGDHGPLRSLTVCLCDRCGHNNR